MKDEQLDDLTIVLQRCAEELLDSSREFVQRDVNGPYQDHDAVMVSLSALNELSAALDSIHKWAEAQVLALRPKGETK